MIDIDSQLTRQQQQRRRIRYDTSQTKRNIKSTILFTFVFLFGGGWPALICSIAAIYYTASVSMIS